MSKKTTEVIINTNNHYLIGVKKNQKSLYTRIEALTADAQAADSWFVELLKTKGRLERREVCVCTVDSDFKKGWVGIKQVIKVQRRVKDKGKIRHEDAFYISSLNVNAIMFCQGIKSHWSIENNLHRVKDVTFDEDASRIRTANAPQNTSVFRNISINLFRTNDYKNMAQAQRLVSNDINKLCQLIN